MGHDTSSSTQSPLIVWNTGIAVKQRCRADQEQREIAYLGLDEAAEGFTEAADICTGISTTTSD
jgi:hypothetical protein